jgi:hypothetical protein
MVAFDQLRDRARGGWLALVVTGLVVLGAMPYYAGLLPREPAGLVATGGGQYSLLVSSGPSGLSRLAGTNGALGLYWLLAVPLAYLLLAGWFFLRARRTGLQQRWGVYVGAGLVLFAVLLISVLPASDPLPHSWRTVTTPLLLLAATLLVLGAVEHDRRILILGGIGSAVALYAGAAERPFFVVPDAWPGEPLLSAATSPQAAVALLAAAMLTCGVAWRPRH